MDETTESRPRGPILYLTIIAVGAAAIALAGLILWLTAGGGWASLTAPKVPIGHIEITVTEYYYVPSSITVPEPGPYEVTLINHGRLDHDITFDDHTTILAPTGGRASAVVTIPEGGTGFECSIPYHSEEGLVGIITPGN